MKITECLDKIYTYLTTTPNKIEDDEPELELESLEDDEYDEDEDYYDCEYDEDYYDCEYEDFSFDLPIESDLAIIPVETSEDEYLKQVLIAENTYLKTVIDLQTYRMGKHDAAYEDLGCILIQIMDINQDLNDQLEKSPTNIKESD